MKVRYAPIGHDDCPLEMEFEAFIDYVCFNSDLQARLLKKLYERDVLSIYDILEILPIDCVEPIL